MSDGHSDSARYSKFYRADQESKERNERRKLEKMCIVLEDNTIVPLIGTQLLFSNEYSSSVVKFADDMISDEDSKLMNLNELVRTMIRKGIV
jgi:hypothetical protein